MVIARAEPASTAAYAERGVRIRFDPMTQDAADRLRGLLADLGLPQDGVEVPLRKAPEIQSKPPSDADASGSDSRVLVQIRRLLIELGEAQGKLDRRTREAEDLVGELSRLRAENANLKERLAQLEEEVRPSRRK